MIQGTERTVRLEHDLRWQTGVQRVKADNANNGQHDGSKPIFDKLIAKLNAQETNNVGLSEHPCALLVFDIKRARFSKALAMQLRSYDAAPGAAPHINVIDCLYLNPITETYFRVDRRVIVTGKGGETAEQAIGDMLVNVVCRRGLLCSTVLVDSWYATRNQMMLIERLGKAYWCRIKESRLANDSDSEDHYQQVSAIAFDSDTLARGKVVALKRFPADHKVRLFRLSTDSGAAEYVITDQLTQDATRAARIMRDLLDGRHAGMKANKIHVRYPMQNLFYAE